MLARFVLTLRYGPRLAGIVAITKLELDPDKGTLYVSGMSALTRDSSCLSNWSRMCLARYSPELFLSWVLTMQDLFVCLAFGLIDMVTSWSS